MALQAQGDGGDLHHTACGNADKMTLCAECGGLTEGVQSDEGPEEKVPACLAWALAGK